MNPTQIVYQTEIFDFSYRLSRISFLGTVLCYTLCITSYLRYTLCITSCRFFNNWLIIDPNVACVVIISETLLFAAREDQVICLTGGNRLQLRWSDEKLNNSSLLHSCTPNLRCLTLSSFQPVTFSHDSSC